MRAKLTEQRVRELRCLAKAGASYKDLSRIAGVNPSSTRKAVLGITWSHVK